MAGKPKQVAERQATGEIERVYHEIRQTLRVTGVNLNFRTWAGYERFFVAMWDAMRPNAETRAFEEAADDVREEALRLARELGPLGRSSLDGLRLGESQRFQIKAALDLYHYVNPKLLVFTCAVREALDGEAVGLGEKLGHAERIERGAPPRMAAMEMVPERPDEPRLRDLFKEIRQTLHLSSLNSDYRTLALWPEYLEVTWGKLKPVVAREEYARAADALREAARRLARDLPYPVPLTRDRLAALGEDVDAVLSTTREFERLLPSLILNIALFVLDTVPGDGQKRSPFPARSREEFAHPGTTGGDLQ